VLQSVTQDSIMRKYIQCLESATSGHTESSDMDHTALSANYTMPAFCFASVHQLAPPPTEVEGIWLELTTHLSTRRDERLSCPGWLTYI